MNQENNFNTQGNNGMPNNQPLNSNQVVGYDSQTGQPIYANENQPQVNANIYQHSYANQSNNPVKKKKLKWWIPVLFFIGGFLMFLGNSVATILVKSQESLVLESDILKNPIIMSFRWLAVICWLMVIPSLIIVIIKHNKKTPEEKMQNNYQVNNMINNANSLDEKLLMSFIGNNYEQIMQQKFSIPALFLSWIYTLYRKIYIPSIIGMVAIIILGFLPSAIYTILVLTFVVVLGINFNKWYVTYAKKQVEKIKINNQTVNENELINICKKKGGTNIWLAILIYAVFAIVSGFLNPNVSQLYGSNTTDTKDEESIENKKELQEYIDNVTQHGDKIKIVNSISDLNATSEYKNQYYKLDSIDNMKIYSDEIFSNLLIGLKTSNSIVSELKTEEIIQLFLSHFGNFVDELYSCYEKDFVIEQSNILYDYEIDVSIDTVYSQGNYYCLSPGGGVHPGELIDQKYYFDGTYHNYIYKWKNPDSSIEKYIIKFIEKNGLYKLYSINNEEDNSCSVTASNNFDFLQKVNDLNYDCDNYEVSYNKLKYVAKKNIYEHYFTYTNSIYYDNTELKYNIKDSQLINTYLLDDSNNNSYLFIFQEIPVPQIVDKYMVVFNDNGEIKFLDTASSQLSYNEKTKELSYISKKEPANSIMLITCDTIKDYDKDMVYSTEYTYKYENNKMNLIKSKETTIGDLRQQNSCN